MDGINNMMERPTANFATIQPERQPERRSAQRNGLSNTLKEKASNMRALKAGYAQMDEDED